jgi:O-antigen/teichoic acid export membrane protein
MVDFKGIQGAAITNFLTKILQVLVMFFYVKQFYRFKVNRAKLVVYPAILVLLLTIATLLDELCNNFMVYSLIGVASLILGYFTYRKEISISWIKEMLKK